MPEKQAIETAMRDGGMPATADSLEADLRALGLSAGRVVLVHSSLSALGWVVGGAQTVIQALMRVVTDAGTLVMPAYTTDNSEPSHWCNPPVPETWWQTIRDQMPAFDRKLTPTRNMGAIAELFRTLPDVRRSDHPCCSFTAWGRYARAIAADHRLNSALGADSPLARVYDFEGDVLLLGVGHDRNSSLHYAEHLADWPKSQLKLGTAIQFDGHRQWVTYEDLSHQSADFPAIGSAFEQAGHARLASVAHAPARLMNQRTLVDFATEWMGSHRK